MLLCYVSRDENVTQKQITYLKNTSEFCARRLEIHMLSGSAVTTAWRVLRLRMEKAVCRYANILNTQSRTADRGWSSSLGSEWGLTNPTVKPPICYEMF
jgi:hypothetical protein